MQNRRYIRKSGAELFRTVSDSAPQVIHRPCPDQRQEPPIVRIFKNAEFHCLAIKLLTKTFIFFTTEKVSVSFNKVQISIIYCKKFYCTVCQWRGNFFICVLLRSKQSFFCYFCPKFNLGRRKNMTFIK